MYGGRAEESGLAVYLILQVYRQVLAMPPLRASCVGFRI